MTSAFEKEQIYQKGYEQGRTDAIEECIKMTTDEKLCQIFEQLKEQKNEY